MQRVSSVGVSAKVKGIRLRSIQPCVNYAELGKMEAGRVMIEQRRAGGIVSRAELYQSVWGRPLREGDRSVDVYVSKLRSKLEAAMPDRCFIHTHPGFGYRFRQTAGNYSP